MLSKIIVTSYALFLEIALWVTLVGSFIGGWAASGFFAGILALIAAFVVCVVVFGGFLTIIDIKKAVRSIEAMKNTGG